VDIVMLFHAGRVDPFVKSYPMGCPFTIAFYDFRHSLLDTVGIKRSGGLHVLPSPFTAMVFRGIAGGE
jgi:hypothetical protein